MKHVSNSTRDTQKIAAELAEKLVKKGVGPLVIALTGELGAGKTVFVQAFAKALGVKGPVNSPTFVLIHPYDIQAGRYKTLYHVDAYRIESKEQFDPLGLGEILEGNKNIVLIEWADRIGELIPENATRIHIEHTGGDTREIEIL